MRFFAIGFWAAVGVMLAVTIAIVVVVLIIDAIVRWFIGDDEQVP
jgi:hypothetical protein